MARKGTRNAVAPLSALSAGAVSTGRQFWAGSTGRWAGEQLIRALQSGEGISPAALRTLDTLRKDEWKEFDEVLIEEAAIRLRGVADLIGAGLVKTVANGMGKTVYEYEKVTDMGSATTSMDGLSRTENDLVEFMLNGLPLPITHKDFFINLRKLMASRERGEALDTTQVRIAGRVVAEATETMLFSGGKTFGGLPIYGYLTHPNRIVSVHFSDDVWSAASVDGADIIKDVLAGIAALEAQRFYGPYWVYVPSGYSTKLEEDFKANGSQTIRQRILSIDRVQKLTVADKCTDGHVIVMQPTMEVACMVEGEALQTIQWDVQGGFQINFKAFTINVPLIRADASSRCGVCDIHHS